MLKADFSIWNLERNFSGDNSTAEKRTRIMVALTATMITVEIIAGHFSTRQH
jgi:hypothetical protein